MRTEALSGGFANQPAEAARAFRAALDAMSRPGTIRCLGGAYPPPPMSAAAGALLLTLADRATPLWLAPGHDSADIRDWIAFHTGAPATSDPRTAVFALGSWEALGDPTRFAAGLPDYPDRSATLIVEMPALRPEGARLTGPGIHGEAFLSVPGIAAFAANRARFPLGFDTFLTCGDRVAAVPRSTIVEAV
jgi:alpha-D-ribose 1-methylphosphonate 5-triphosphate synthase subunit PhnH